MQDQEEINDPPTVKDLKKGAQPQSMRNVFTHGKDGANEINTTSSFKKGRDSCIPTASKMQPIQEQMYEAYTEHDQTESYYDESDLTSLCGDDLNEHAPDTLLKRDVT